MTPSISEVRLNFVFRLENCTHVHAEDFKDQPVWPQAHVTPDLGSDKFNYPFALNCEAVSASIANLKLGSGVMCPRIPDSGPVECRLETS